MHPLHQVCYYFVDGTSCSGRAATCLLVPHQPVLLFVVPSPHQEVKGMLISFTDVT